MIQARYEECCKLAIAINRLSLLAAAINAEHRAAFGAAEKALEHAAECGRRLIEAKSLLPHGEWLPWLEANTEVVPRQSQKYMRLANNWEEIRKANQQFAFAHQPRLELIADQRVIRAIAPRTGNPEWFTPLPPVIDAARMVFGGEISLDPASCAEAQKHRSEGKGVL